MFRVFGHENVWVLDGGMPKWCDSKFDVESSASSDAILKATLAHEAIEKVYKGEMVSLLLLRGQICFTNVLNPVVHFYVLNNCHISYIFPLNVFSWAFIYFQVPPFTFQTKMQPHLVWTHEQVTFLSIESAFIFSR